MTRRRNAILVLALAAWVAWLYRRVLFGGMSFALRDHLVLGLPIRTYLGESIRAGRIPQWWDGVGLGVPFAASPVHQALAPLGWLFAVLPMPFGADVEPVAYLLVAAVGTALLAGRLGADGRGMFLAGAIAGTSGYLNSIIVNGNLPFVAWAPWVAWATAEVVDALRGGERPIGPMVALTVTVALQVWSAEPAATVTALLLGVAVLVAKGPTARAFGWLALGVLMGVGLAAVQLVPAAFLVGGTDRGGGFDLGTASDWSLHPIRLAEILWPRLLGDAVDPTLDLGRMLAADGAGSVDPSWSYSVFLGVPVLVLAVGGAVRGRKCLLLAAAAVLLLLALGSHAPAFQLLRAVFPPERYARFPEKHFLGVVVLLAALAGSVLGCVRDRPRRWALTFGVSAAALAALIGAFQAERGVLASALAGAAGARGIDLPAAMDVSVRWGAFAAAAAATAAIGALLAGHPRTRLAGELVIAAAILVPAAANVGSFTYLVPRASISDPPALLRFEVGEGPQPPRLYRPRVTSEPVTLGAAGTLVSFETAAINTGSRFGFQVIPGHDVAFDREWVEFWDDAHRRLSPWQLAALFGARWVAVDAFAALPPYPGPVLSRARRLSVIEFAGARPRAFVTDRWLPVRSRSEAIAALRAPERADDAALVLLETPGDTASARPRGGAPARACVVRSTTPEETELLCDAAGSGYAVLLDAYGDGWRAEVDGRSVDALRADGFFRAVPIAAGPHRIRFSYATPGLILGLSVSLFTAAAASAAALLQRRRDRQRIRRSAGQVASVG
jgi:hypothetical protein